MSANLQQVDVRLAERSYTIEIGRRTLVNAAQCVAADAPSHVVLIADANVELPHAATVAESLSTADIDVDLVIVEAGEPSKSIEVAAELWQKLLDLGTDRRSAVVAVGGGVIGDLAGFVAATYARGLPFYQVPTTLLAQVDSSVGGKVGINLPAAKNMVGAFWQPRGVLIDVDTLTTLPEREYRSGLGEVVKYGVILDASFFAYLEQHIAQLNARDCETLVYVIQRCCRLKADIVEADERETTGSRAALNYGHTFAHAFEATSGYGEYLHGEAVSIGMLCASRLAERLGRIDRAMTDRQQALLVALGLPIGVPTTDPDLLLRAMMHDKKVEHGKLRFVLPTQLGHVELVGNVAESDVRAALQHQ